MGFLDHSTNNIILDAVLTDTGRQYLARNDGSFSVYMFALGDDEINYGIIRKYGRTVGKEKIEKNTPIFEALTLESQAQKYKLVGVSNPNFIKFPKLFLSGDNTLSNDIFTLYPVATIGKPVQSKIVLTQEILNESSIDVELRDEMFEVNVPHLFLKIVGSAQPNNIDRMQRATYTLRRSSVTSANGAVLEFNVACKSLTSSMFDVYGTGASRSTIKTYIRVTGMSSGAVRDVAIHIKQPGNYSQCD